jgi:Ni,Fe-hydrogenase III small subunit
LRARRAFVVVGAVPGEDAAAFVSALRAGNVLPIPVDARTPEEADVILLVGRVSTKAASAVAQLRSRAPHALIVAFDAPQGPSYATAPAAAVLDADVVVTGLPPSAAAIDAVLAAVLQHTRGGP